MLHQTKIVQKRVPPKKLHHLPQLFADFDETRAVLKVSNRKKIVCKDIFKKHLEVEICYLIVGALISLGFFSLV